MEGISEPLASAELPLIGRGTHCECRAFPGDPTRCVKIVHDFSRGGGREIAREARYFARLRGRLRDWRCLPRFYGTVATDAGTGYVFERVADFDGSASVTLERFMRERRGAEDFALFRKMLGELRRWLFANGVVVRNLRPYNILCRRVSETDCVPVLCDNLGARRLTRLYEICGPLGRFRMRCKWRDFLAFPPVAEYVANCGRSGADSSVES